MKGKIRPLLAAFAVCLAATLVLSGCASAPLSASHKAKSPATGEAKPEMALVPAPRDEDGGKAGTTAPEPVMTPEKPRESLKTDKKALSDGATATGKEEAADVRSLKKPAADAEEIAVAGTRGAVGGGDREAPPSESGLKAGYSDDNDQFNYFVKFLSEYGPQVESYPLKIGERIILTVKDAKGKPACNAEIAVQVGGKTVAVGRSYASGAFHLYPLEYPEAPGYSVIVSYSDEKKTVKVDRKGPRSVEIKLDGTRKIAKETPLDILFVMDTTGSMGEEIVRLQDMMEIIHDNVSAVTPKPAVRFGLVLYRDKDDAYVTKIVPFTSDMIVFQDALDEIEADGGGDNPEDLQSALSDAVNKMEWNRDGVRLAFVITDAEPHLDYGQSYTYASAARDAKAKGIKLFSVGTGGLPLQGEYVLRQISQFTAARYIFLTYGEKSESEGGAPASVSHHTGSNFQTDKLEAIIIRFAREELAFLSDVPLTAEDDFFDAKRVGGEQKDATLDKLFRDSLKNLVDYSTLSLKPESKAALMPIGVSETDSGLSKQAEYFSEAMLLSAMKSKPFVIVDRKDIQKILEEQQLQYSGLADEAKAVKLGAILGAEVMVVGKLYLKDGKYEIFLKLLRVETGEVLSVSKAKLEKDLGL
jgi:Mg-chelatase subunit ChlD